MKQYTIQTYPLPEGYNLTDYKINILQKLIDRLTFAFSKTSQILFVRLDIRQPQIVESDGSNTCFQWFWEEYMRKLREYVLGFVWTREQHNSHNCHWHTIIFFDQNKMRYFGYPFTANSLWAKAIEKFYKIDAPKLGLIESAPLIRNGLVVHRDNELLQDEALRIAAYIAKKKTKGEAPYHVREFGVSYV